LVEATAVETLQSQFSGYGSTSSHIVNALDTISLKAPLETWAPETIRSVVSAFVDAKFPTVLALNKIDHPDADANVARIAKVHPPESLVLTSAISEVFLRRLAKQGFIRYTEGSDVVETREDLIEDGDSTGGGLKEMDDKLKTRIENLRDMVLYRFGSTGVVQVLSRAAEILGLVPVFPVKNAHAFGTSALGSDAANQSDSKAGSGSGPLFRDCVLVKRGTTVREVARKVVGDAPLAFVEGPGGMKISEEESVGVGKHDILCFKIGR
jgi:ribosome-binding ATPase